MKKEFFSLLGYFLFFSFLLISCDNQPVLLPNPPQDPPELHERNIMKVYVNMDNEIMVTAGKDEPITLTVDELGTLRELAKIFITANTPGGVVNDKYPEPKKEPYRLEYPSEDGEVFTYPTTFILNQHVITLQTDRATKYEVYFKVQEALYGAYNDLRKEFAHEAYGDKELTEVEQGLCNRRYINMISEAQPIEIGKRQR